MIEDDLRATFGRHEQLTPSVEPLRAAIDRAVRTRRRRRSRLRLAGAALAVLLTAGLGVPLAVASRDRTASVDLIGDPAAPAAQAGALNLLLLGLDGTADGPPSRADSILLVHLPADRGAVYLVALPRDLTVPVPGRGQQKLNSVASIGADRNAGWELTRSAVTDLTGVRIDIGATLTFSGLRKLTDELDGVPICLPRQVRSEHSDRVFPAGCQRLDGAAAVDLLRQRRDLPEGARDRHAQLYTAALLRQAGQRNLLTDPVRLLRLLRVLSDHMTLSSGVGPEVIDEAARLTGRTPVVAIDLPVQVGGQANRPELRLHDTRAEPLFAALRDGRLAEWARTHPEQATVQR